MMTPSSTRFLQEGNYSVVCTAARVGTRFIFMFALYVYVCVCVLSAYLRVKKCLFVCT